MIEARKFPLLPLQNYGTKPEPLPYKQVENTAIRGVHEVMGELYKVSE